MLVGDIEDTLVGNENVFVLSNADGAVLLAGNRNHLEGMLDRLHDGNREYRFEH